MTSPYRIERDRGTEEARQQLAVLREKWPLAFPVKDQDVRPLAMGAARQVAAAMGWSLPYTLGVLGRWKMAPVYCQAVLCYDQRIALDGSSAETVDAEAKDLATKQLVQLAARKAAKKAAEAPAPAVVKPKHAPAPAPPTETPEQLRDRVRPSPNETMVKSKAPVLLFQCLTTPPSRARNSDRPQREGDEPRRGRGTLIPD
jgi:sRNA-binding protein